MRPIVEIVEIVQIPTNDYETRFRSLLLGASSNKDAMDPHFASKWMSCLFLPLHTLNSPEMLETFKKLPGNCFFYFFTKKKKMSPKTFETEKKRCFETFENPTMFENSPKIQRFFSGIQAFYKPSNSPLKAAPLLPRLRRLRGYELWYSHSW